MMGGSCSTQRRSRSRRSRDGRRRTRSSGLRFTSTTSRISRICGGDDEENSEDGGRTGVKGTRATRHSVDVEVPNNSISHFYPPQDNYIPHTDGTRSPKSLVDLCINSLCRSLPNCEELPPGLPQELVDRILASLTSHGALNSTTLRCLGNCELTVLNLANCRGVSDDWFINTRGSGFGMRSLSPARKKESGRQRPRSASMPYGVPSAAAMAPPCRGIHHEFSTHSQDCSYSMDVDDDSERLDSSPHYSMEEGSEADEDFSASSSSESFVSAFSSPHNPPSTSSHDSEEITREVLRSTPLLPSVLPTPDFFSMKTKPMSMWQNPSGGGICMPLYPTSIRQPPPLLPYVSSLHTNESVEGSPEYSDHDDYHSSLAVLDLRGSRISDRGLLRLSQLPLVSLEVVKLDNCHGITGRGLISLAHSEKLHTLSLANCRRITDEAIINVSHLKRSLLAINVGGCRCLTDRSLEGLAGLVELRKLDLSQCDLITDEGLAYLHDLELIQELSLGWCRQITDRGMSILAEQPNRSHTLRVLRLARCPVSDEGLEHIGKLSSLEELDLNGCINITGKALGDTLAKLVHISSLDVSYCPGILRSSWQGKISNLRSLELCYSRVSDTHMSRLSNLPKLEELNLDSCPVGDWTIAHLADNNVIPNITTLDLADTDLSDIGMAKISQFRHLKKLSLFYCNISNSGLRHLSSLTTLEVLNLDSRDIGDDGLRYLRNLPLVSLDLFSGRVTDLGCAFLSKIKTLVNLELCGGGIGDLGCSHLATLSSLECLNLSQNERITNSGAAALATLTNLKALNLSNTHVTPYALKFFSGLLKLQSLALYGLRDMIDSPHLESLQSELPSLRCLRLNSEENEDGVINHNDSDSEDASHIVEEDDDSNLSESGGFMFPYHSLQSDGSSDIDEFEDAYHDHDEIESLEDVMDNDSSWDEEEI